MKICNYKTPLRSAKYQNISKIETARLDEALIGDRTNSTYMIYLILYSRYLEYRSKNCIHIIVDSTLTLIILKKLKISRISTKLQVDY